LYDSRLQRKPLLRLIIAGLFAALAVALNYALIAIPQVKLFNLIIFVAGYFGGIYSGVLAGGIAAAVYSIINPYNMGIFPPLPLLLSQIFCMGIIGASGGFSRRLNFLSGGKAIQILKAATIGLVLSAFYNIVVTASGAYLFGTFKEAFILAIPAMLLNIAVNIIFFALLLPIIVPLKDKFKI